MTYEEFFKNGDKFLYESHAFSDYIIYDVEIVDMRVENNNKYSMFNDTRFYKTHYDFPHLFIVKEWLI